MRHGEFRKHRCGGPEPWDCPRCELSRPAGTRPNPPGPPHSEALQGTHLAYVKSGARLRRPAAILAKALDRVRRA